MPLPNDILEIAGRVWEYHMATKLTETSPAFVPARVPPRIFDYLPKVPLSPKLLDLPTPTLTVLTKGVDALPESMQSPPQDLRTLSTWLYMAAGKRPGVPEPRPAEIFVAAFAIAGLDTGLYHFAPAEYALRQLRDGPETLALLRRGRPDLHFLGTVPAALLVSTLFSTAGAVGGRRGYRTALLDAGGLAADCIAVATGLGIRTVSRLKMTDGPTRELIGLPEDYDDASAEAVQAMVVWADEATSPMPPGDVPDGPLMSVPRPPSGVSPPPIVVAVHREVVARGVPAREIRPPWTDLSPVAVNVPTDTITGCRELPSKSLRETLTAIRPAERFVKKPVGRDQLCLISTAGFRTGTVYPLHPEGGHAALVRGMWVAQDAVAHEPGLWYHDVILDGWGFLENGEFGAQTGPLTRNRFEVEDASAVCAIVANLRKLLLEAGPDAYRLAHVEAGLAARRMTMAAASLGFASQTYTDFHDDAWKHFLRLSATGWEVVAVFALGGPAAPRPVQGTPVQSVSPPANEKASGVIGFKD